MGAFGQSWGLKKKRTCLNYQTWLWRSKADSERRKGRRLNLFPQRLRQHTHPDKLSGCLGTECQIFLKFDLQTIKTFLCSYLEEQYTMAQFSNWKKYPNIVLNTIIIMLPQDDNAKSHDNTPMIHETVIKNNVNT